MHILFENYHYEKYPFGEDNKPSLEEVLAEGKINAKHVESDTKLSVDYVGYFYSHKLEDCVFILPNVLLDENGIVLGKVGSIENEGQISGYAPERFLHINRQGVEGVGKDMSAFVYEFSLWVYRAINVYRHRNPDSDIAVNPEITQMGRGKRRDRYTFVDIVLALLDFNKNNQDYLTFILRNIHSGNNKINWTKTIAQNRVLVQNDTPIYYQPVNKKKQINYDEELLIIYYSILHHIHEKYNFPVHLNANFDLITGKRFEQYIKGIGKRRLKQIKYKYFSDRDLEIWNLCYAFFDYSYKVAILYDKSDYLLIHDFPAVFEDMVDELLSENDEEVRKMKVQEDNKRLDHLYRYQGLTEFNDKIYYIGDSKYYNRGHNITDDSIAKQYTYARNLVQYNLDLFHSNKEEDRKKALLYRDEETEGYDIVPNFFISAKIDDISSNGYNDSSITSIPTANGERFHVSCHFKNRLFDRDTILVAHYNVNFLFVLSLYAKNRKMEQQAWSDKVKAQFRKEIIDGLNKEFHFYVMTPREHIDGHALLHERFKDVLGKVFQPYSDSEQGQTYYSLALQKSTKEMSEKERKDLEMENERVKELLVPYFEILECDLGVDKRNELQTPAPDGVIYAKETDLALLIVKENVQFVQALEKISETKKVGIALKMDGATLQLVEGFTKAKYLILHNKRDKKAYKIMGNGPKLVPKDNMVPMVVTKQGEELYLVYEVNTEQEVNVGKLDFSIITKKGADSYSPWLFPLEKLQLNEDVILQKTYEINHVKEI